MIKKPIVFIVGAGASAEFEFPLGSRLLDSIREDVCFTPGEISGLSRGNFQLYQSLNNSSDPTYAGCIACGPSLANSIVPFLSIDEALHWMRHNETMVELGKVAIAKAILDAERRSPLKLDGGDIHHKSWLSEFLALALGGRSQKEVRGVFTNVTVISFNYDRSIEQYLIFALEQLAGTEFNDAVEAVRSLKIIRPYGYLGPLDWLATGRMGVRYGGDRNEDYRGLPALAKRIRTFTEQVEDAGLSAGIASSLENAEAVFILGFGYHQQNMAMLARKKNRPTRTRPILATAFGIHERNHATLKAKIDSDIGGNTEIIPMTGRQMMLELRPMISTIVS